MKRGVGKLLLRIRRIATCQHTTNTRASSKAAKKAATCRMPYSAWILTAYVLCRNGSQRPVELTSSPLLETDGSGALIRLRDLNRQRELERDQQRLATIPEESPNPIVELDTGANMVYAKPAMMDLIALFGFTEDALPAILPPTIVQIVTTCLEEGGAQSALEISSRGLEVRQEA